MKKNPILIILCLFTFNIIVAQSTADPKETEYYTPVPKKVTPGTAHKPPSDAIVLFNGTDMNQWVMSKDTSPSLWVLDKRDGSMTVPKGKGGIQTKRSFGDCQLHIEWRSPNPPHGKGQDCGNSGVFLSSKYEVQVLDNYTNTTYVNGQAGSIYKQSVPLVNACLKPGEWQTYDIIYMAPKFDASGVMTMNGNITVLHNGVLVQNHYIIKGTTEYRGAPQVVPHGNLPIALQDHNHPVSYRNIWIREL